MKRMLVLLWVWLAGVGVVQASREGVFTGLVGERTVGTGGALERQAFWSGNGSVEVNSLSTGAFSGSIRWEGRSHGFAGQWDAGGNASVSVARAGRSTLAVTLKHREVGLGEVNGSVDNGKQVVDFVLRRADAWTGGGEHPLGGRRYTVLLGAPKELGVGYGVGSVSITSNGRWTLGGYLGNGQGLTAFGRVVDGGGESWILPVFVGGQSVVSGEVEVWKSERAEGSDAGGSLVWLKNVEGGVPAGKFLKELEVVGTLHWQEGSEMKTGLGGGTFALEFGAGSGGLSAAVKQNGTWPSEGSPVFGAGALGGTGVRYKGGLGRFEGRFESGTGAGKLGAEYRGVLLSRTVTLADGRELRGGGYYAGGVGSGVLALTSEASSVVRSGMVSVLGGTLPSGSVLAGQSVGDFEIGRTEVTWGEWNTVRDWAVANGYADLADVGAGSGDDYPVGSVNWYHVVKWCNARSEKEGKTPVYWVNGGTYKTGQSVPAVKTSADGYRLPTDSEWEWAARGGRQTHGYTYSGGNEANAVAWTVANSGNASRSVGTKAPNELGLFDMSGNVWEWCWNFDAGNPLVRRVRGGSWYDSADIASIYADAPETLDVNIGFRLARGTWQWVSAEAGLSGLVLSSGTLSPGFVSGGTAYSVSEGSGVTNITVTPTVSPDSATVEVRMNGGAYETVKSGKASGALSLKTGANTLEVKVTAEDGVTVKTYTVNVTVASNMVSLLGGTLPSGSGLAGQSVGNFQIGKTEVTWGEWKLVREWAVAHGYDLAGAGSGSGDTHPVREVSGYEVMKWCNAKSERDAKTPVYQLNGSVYKSGESSSIVKTSANGYRLPTEAEWEWAARGGTQARGYAYSGSNDLNAVGWWLQNSTGAAVDLYDGHGSFAVGAKAPNELGLYDMSGNVFEWCLDFSSSGTSTLRFRGGGWGSWFDFAAVSHRGNVLTQGYRCSYIGFRLTSNPGQ